MSVELSFVDKSMWTCCATTDQPDMTQFTIRAEAHKPTTEVVLPLSWFDCSFLRQPISASAYGSYSYVIQCEPALGFPLAERMRLALSEMVETAEWFPLCGRIDEKRLGVVGSNRGIPFAVLDASHEFVSDEALANQDVMYATGDVRMPAVSEPLLTVVVGIFKNVTVLTISVQHAVFDGSGITRFVDKWAQWCRGERPVGVLRLKERQLLHQRCGENLEPQLLSDMAIEWIFTTVFAQMNRSFLRSLREHKPQKMHIGSVLIPADVVVGLKAAAQDAVRDAVPFITTQEAVVAKLLLVLWRLCGDTTKPKRNAVLFWLSGRRFLEKEADVRKFDYHDDYGNFVYLHRADVYADLRTASVADVAAELHESLAAITSDTIRDWLGPLEKSKVTFSGSFSRIHSLMNDKEYGYQLMINNLSKFPLPTWTSADHLGHPLATDQLFSMAGPNALIVASNQGGLRLNVHSEALKKKATIAQLQAAILADK